MLVNAFARGAWALLAALVVLGGCRSSTDRIRVLEAEKADLARQNHDLRNDQAHMKSKSLELEATLESEREKRLALEQATLRDRPAAATEDGDMSPVKDLDAEGLEVFANDDGGATIVLASDITFRPGRADLNREAEATLREVARAINESGGYSDIRVEGHTDSDPIRKSGWRSNEELSMARAEVVRAYLVNQGVGETGVQVNGFGARRPIASNTTREGKKRNRRVEIVVVGDR